MLSDWCQTYRQHNLFIINKTWGIRDSIIHNDPAIIVHRCSNGKNGNIYYLEDSNYKCNICSTHIPDEVQALWVLRTWEVK